VVHLPFGRGSVSLLAYRAMPFAFHPSRNVVFLGVLVLHQFRQSARSQPIVFYKIQGGILQGKASTVCSNPKFKTKISSFSLIRCNQV